MSTFASDRELEAGTMRRVSWRLMPFLLFAWASRHLPAGYTAILNGTTPLFGTVAAALALREIPSPGALLGILMMIPLRRALIVAQHGKLKYPEGTACAAVLKAGALFGEMAVFDRSERSTDAISNMTTAQVANLTTDQIVKGLTQFELRVVVDVVAPLRQS